MVTRASSALVLLTLLLAACGGSGGSSTPRATLEVAGPKPSATASMVCEKEARDDIASAVEIDAARVTAPRWDAAGHVLSCTYLYPRGAKMVLTVKELSSVDETNAFYDGEAARLGRTRSLEIAQGAFRTTDGSLVVRKDYKVLVIDVSGLPSRFGPSASDRGTFAVNVATQIMSCWVGA
jgi:hypothetical protein